MKMKMLAILVAAIVGVSLMAAPSSASAEKRKGASCSVILHRAAYKGTENQPYGVRYANRYGWAEIDAAVTKDGRVLAIHDAKLGRVTGGELKGFVNEYRARRIKRAKHPFGRFRSTARLIRVAARMNRPIMITINNWTRVKAAGRDEATLDVLYNAAQRHPRPHLVWFGGFGSERDMRERHPKAATFHRYSKRDKILADVRANDVDLVGLPRARWERPLVRKLKRAGARVATRQVTAKWQVRLAQRKGINIIQSSYPRKTVRRWCR